MASALIIVPAYNEELHIGKVAASCKKHGPVLVIDDGSRDNTAAEASKSGAEVVSQRNMGKGAALRTGFSWGLERGYASFITLDADGQHDPDEIPLFLACDEESLVIGARRYREMPFPRNLSNAFGRWMMEMTFKQKIRDNQSGYRRIPAKLAKNLLASVENGFEFEVEMIARHVAAGGRIEWVPIKTIYGDEKSHIRPVQHVLKFFRVARKCRKILKNKQA